MKDLRAIVLAAGKGTRMKSDIPKVLHTVAGKALIEYAIDLVMAVGSLKICLVLGHQVEGVKKFLQKKGKVFDVAVQKKLLGTADAVRSAAGFFRSHRGHVLILCGDTPLLCNKTVDDLVKRHFKSRAACTLLTAVVEKSDGYGRILRDASGKVTGIREHNDANKIEKNIKEINVGVYCFESGVLFESLKQIKMNPQKKEFYLTDIIGILVKRDVKIESVSTQDWREGLGVNTREDLATAEGILRQRILKSFMLSGVTIVDPQTTYIHEDVKIGTDTTIRPFTVIENDVRIGQRCSIGPFARLRPGSRIANGVEVGNFAEVSRSQIGERSLMKHFGFIGDAEVGRNVNIGAGTVTANFDGKTKNKTIISDQAFIGSDSILVAPVKIGKKAITGAGCVVTKGKIIPDESIVVGVPGKVISKKLNSGNRRHR